MLLTIYITMMFVNEIFLKISIHSNVDQVNMTQFYQKFWGT